MNINIPNEYDKILSFLNQIIYQLSNHNSISVESLKILCNLIYKQNTIEKIKEFQPFILTALSYISSDTKTYNEYNFEVEKFDEILKGHINNNLIQLYEDNKK